MKYDENKINKLIDIVSDYGKNDFLNVKQSTDVDNIIYIINELLKSTDNDKLNNYYNLDAIETLMNLPIKTKNSDELEFIDNFEFFIKNTKEYYLIKCFMRVIKLNIIGDINVDTFIDDYDKVRISYLEFHKMNSYNVGIYSMIKNISANETLNRNSYLMLAYLLYLFEYLNVNVEKLIMYVLKYEKLKIVKKI